MLGEKCIQQLCNVPLSNNTGSRRIADMSEASEQLTEKSSNKCFSVQIDKATDLSGIGLSMAYVRYVRDTKLMKTSLSNLAEEEQQQRTLQNC
jgi:hypothetical protein